MSSHAEKLAGFIHSVKASELPDSVKIKAGQCLIDYLGAAWNAQGRELADAYATYAVNMAGGRGGAADVIGKELALPPFWAAFANAAQGHVTEVDDGHRLSIMHIGAVVIPVVLALAQDRGLDGAAMLEAVVCGYDLAIRAGECLGPEHYVTFHTTGTAGTFGAAAAAAKCLGLSEKAVAWALGHAGTQAAGLWQFLQDGAVRAKPFHPAKAAQNGIQAAFLAEGDIEGALRIFEGEKGLCSYAAENPRYDLLTRDIGTIFKITEVNFKGYPTCGQTHSMLDALAAIMTRDGINAEDVESLEAHVYRRAIDIAGIPEPENLEQAKFSNQFCLAFMLRHNGLTFANFTEEALEDRAVRELSRRVTLHFDPEMDAGFPESRPCRVVARCKDGRILSRENRFRKGDPENPMDTPAMEEKLGHLAGALLSPAQRREMSAWCLDLENQKGCEPFLFHIIQ
jgi:2-methylcitrate dehydratase PrpD